VRYTCRAAPAERAAAVRGSAAAPAERKNCEEAERSYMKAACDPPVVGTERRAVCGWLPQRGSFVTRCQQGSCLKKNITGVEPVSCQIFCAKRTQSWSPKFKMS
jgi:hypothetical protein